MGSKTLSSHYSLIPYMRAASPCGGVGLWVSYGPYSESGRGCQAAVMLSGSTLCGMPCGGMTGSSEGHSFTSLHIGL